jgi:hypothetical protein
MKLKGKMMIRKNMLNNLKHHQKIDHSTFDLNFSRFIEIFIEKVLKYFFFENSSKLMKKKFFKRNLSIIISIHHSIAFKDFPSHGKIVNSFHQFFVDFLCISKQNFCSISHKILLYILKSLIQPED